MILLRPSAERGSADHGWLQSRFSFSFAGYHDPAHVRFHGLRVINEDRVAPRKGFGMHPHRDMEILTWVRQGRLEHADTIGNHRAIEPGELQVMSAGAGLLHSEYNPSATEPVHFFQVWIEPARRGIKPSYAQARFAADGRRGRFQLLASADGADGSLSIHAEARFFVADLSAGEQLRFEAASGRSQYLHVAEGRIQLNGMWLDTGDAAKIEAEPELHCLAGQDSHLLLFDLKATSR
jgi:redox-sensitive bicupin YhaK (pirin superfamily)